MNCNYYSGARVKLQVQIPRVICHAYFDKTYQAHATIDEMVTNMNSQIATIIQALEYTEMQIPHPM